MRRGEGGRGLSATEKRESENENLIWDVGTSSFSNACSKVLIDKTGTPLNFSPPKRVAEHVFT